MIRTQFSGSLIAAQREQDIWWRNGEMGDVGSCWVLHRDGRYHISRYYWLQGQSILKRVRSPEDRFRLYTLWTPTKKSAQAIQHPDHPMLWSFGRFFVRRCRNRSAWVAFNVRSFVESAYYEVNYALLMRDTIRDCLHAEQITRIAGHESPFDRNWAMDGDEFRVKIMPWYFYD